MKYIPKQELPGSWVWAELNNICEAIRGVTFDAKEAKDGDFSGGIACLTTASIQENVDWGTRRFIPEARVTNERQIVQDGDILVSTANSRNLVGKSCLVDRVLYRCTFGAFVTLLRPSTLIDPYFLANWLRVPQSLQYFFERSSNTTNISNLRTKELLELPIPLPPLPEQQRIVAILSQADELRRLRRQADERARSLLPALFEEMFGDPIRHQPGWDLVSLGDVADVTAKLVNPQEQAYANLPLIGSENIESYTGRLINVPLAGDIRAISGKFLYELS